MRRAVIYAKWALASLAALAALVWVGDAVYVRARMSHKTQTDPVDSIKIRPLYVVPLKDGRAELDFGDPETQSCVHSLFPHLGYDPCWYVLRQSKKPIPIASFPSMRIAAEA
jgi:hypothetical protein